MLVEGVVVGDLVVLAFVIGRRIVLGAVDHTGLQRGVQFVVGDLHAVAAHGVDHVDEHRVLHDADLHAGKIAGLLDLLALHVEGARSGVHVAKADEASRLQFVEQAGADLAVDDDVLLVEALEHVGQVEDIEIVHDRADHADRNAGHL